MAELLEDNKSDSISDDKSDNKSDNVYDDKSDKKNDNDTCNCDAREAIRRQFYKNPIRKDNIKLEIDDNTPQEERRRLLLEYQKKYV